MTADWLDQRAILYRALDALLLEAPPSVVRGLTEIVENTIVAAEQRGREDNADHGMCYVSGSGALNALLRATWYEGYGERPLCDVTTMRAFPEAVCPYE